MRIFTSLNFRISFKNFIALLIGNVFLALGIAIFKFSNLGNDPYTAAMFSLSDLTPLSYATFTVIINSLFFIVQFIFGKKYIGIGTIFNWVFLGYIVTFFYNILELLFNKPSIFYQQFLYLILGVIIVSFGVSFYQTSNSGISPYDSLSLILTDYLPIPYFWCRLLTDILCAIACFLTGGLLGLGTLICALCLGPFIHLFNHFISEPILETNKK